jgi:hypothetical protein
LASLVVSSYSEEVELALVYLFQAS